MTNGDETIFPSLNPLSGEPFQLEDYDDPATPELWSAARTPGMMSLRFITAAIRRSGLFLLLMAIVGPIVAMGVYAATPHNYQATASVLLTLTPFENGQSSQTLGSDNQAIAETRPVASLALQSLGLQESLTSFVSSYTVTSVTERVLEVTASGPSSSAAELRATAIATAFLKFRANGQQTDLDLQLQSLSQQVSQAQRYLNSITAQITQLAGQATSSAQQNQLSKLRVEQTNATNNLASLQQAVTNQQTTTQPALTAALKSSQILSVVALPRSKLKSPASYAIFGIIAGLAVGLAIVIIRALVSDRLRQRDDIAYALEAPVNLSVGSLRPGRLPGRAAQCDQDMRRVIAHLRGTVSRTSRRPASLAVVAVDNAPVVARVVAALAMSSAHEGQQVMAADLSRDGSLARTLGVNGAGTHAVRHGGADFTVIVPDRRDATPVGPLRAGAAPAESALAGDAVLGADADVLLTLVTLDPALSADHLATWTTSAVVAVTAGQSSAERVHSVGEMVRLAKVSLDSVILIGADDSDETLGQISTSDEEIGLGVFGW